MKRSFFASYSPASTCSGWNAISRESCILQAATSLLGNSSLPENGINRQNCNLNVFLVLFHAAQLKNCHFLLSLMFW